MVPGKLPFGEVEIDAVAAVEERRVLCTRDAH